MTDNNMSQIMVRYVKFVPDNLQEELNFIGVLYKSGVISRDNFVKMQGILEVEHHIPNDNPENYDTGNDFLFSIHGEEVINRFINIMSTDMPKSSYKISEKPFGKLIDKEDRNNNPDR